MAVWYSWLFRDIFCCQGDIYRWRHSFVLRSIFFPECYLSRGNYMNYWTNWMFMKIHQISKLVNLMNSHKFVKCTNWWKLMNIHNFMNEAHSMADLTVEVRFSQSISSVSNFVRHSQTKPSFVWLILASTLPDSASLINLLFHLAFFPFSCFLIWLTNECRLFSY